MIFVSPSPILATKARALADQCGGLVQGREIVSLVYVLDRASWGFTCSFSSLCMQVSVHHFTRVLSFCCVGMVNGTGQGHQPYGLAGSWSVSFLPTMPVDTWAQGAGMGLLLRFLT